MDKYSVSVPNSGGKLDAKFREGRNINDKYM